MGAFPGASDPLFFIPDLPDMTYRKSLPVEKKTLWVGGLVSSPAATHTEAHATT
jgi:hypothetical protein